jgi:sulfur carrier protein ThiS
LIFYHHRGTIIPEFKRGRAMVKVMYRDKTWEMKPGSTVRHIIEKAGLNPESVLAVRNGRLINEATLTEDGDTIKLVAVVSGG